MYREVDASNILRCPLLTKPSWIGYYNINKYIYLKLHFDLKHEKGDHYVYHVTLTNQYMYIYIFIEYN